MMERNDVAVLGEAALKDLIAQPPEISTTALVRVTSGTSGEPIVMATGYSPDAPEDIAGDASVRRMLVCIGSRTARLSNILIARAGPRDRALRVLPIDQQDVDDRLTPLLSDFSPEGVHGFPAIISRVGAHMDASTKDGVRTAKLTGEVLTEERDSALQAMYKNARLIEIYIASEVGGRIGVRSCGYLPRAHFHPALDVEIEVANPDAEGVGDLLVTRPVFRGFRVESYRIGDMAKLVRARCACGAETTFALVGRRGIDYIKIVGALIRREEFDRVCATFPDAIDDYRAEVSEVHVAGQSKGRIALTLFRAKGTPTEARVHEIARLFADRVFLTQTATLAQLVERDVFLPLEVTYTDAPFSVQHKEVKLIQI